MIIDGLSTPLWFDSVEEVPLDEVTYAPFEPEGFSDADAQVVIGVYVCSLCEGDLEIVYLPDTETRMVECPEHGNIERIGRISKTTVAIRNERGIFDFPRVIRNLSEYWGELIPTKQDRERMIKELGF